MSEKVTKLQKVTKKLHLWRQYFTILYYNCNFVTYIYDTIDKKHLIFHDLSRGCVCRKKSYKVTKIKNALKYGFRNQHICNFAKSYKIAPLANIGKYRVRHFYQKVTQLIKVTKSLIIGGDRYYQQ